MNPLTFAVRLAVAATSTILDAAARIHIVTDGSLDALLDRRLEAWDAAADAAIARQRLTELDADQVPATVAASVLPLRELPNGWVVHAGAGH